ncbi:hypothetical protein [Pseudomonas sp.]|uniref:hypothetical protein n=1 Tax=Pseudomonas sp. TaxID=306 RepID=UPI003241D23D
MAYVNGSAASWGDLLSALVSACTDEGWAWNDGILSKGTAFVKLWVRSPETLSEGEGILLQGGTGQAAAVLTDPSPQMPRLGCPSRLLNQVVWPVDYYVHIHSDPDEVYFVVRYSVDYYLWCAFGVSTLDLPGSGLWLSAISRRLRGPNNAGIRISALGGGGTRGTDDTSDSQTSAGLLWNGNGSGSGGSQSADSQNNAVCTGFDGNLWPWPSANSNSHSLINTIHANVPLSPLLVRSVGWNQQAALLPIQPVLVRAESKVSKVADLAHARYVRVDNLEAGQIIAMGGEQWRVYPFYRRVPGVTSVTNEAHTGAFGMAIRYDGP